MRNVLIIEDQLEAWAFGRLPTPRDAQHNRNLPDAMFGAGARSWIYPAATDGTGAIPGHATPRQTELGERRPQGMKAQQQTGTCPAPQSGPLESRTPRTHKYDRMQRTGYAPALQPGPVGQTGICSDATAGTSQQSWKHPVN